MIKKIISRMEEIGLSELPSGQFDREAAVLMIITRDPVKPGIILTKRAGHLSAHSGEVAFPGGKWEPGDEDLLQTALRETEEEIGLAPQSIEVLGALAPHFSKGMVKVTPFIGLVDSGVRLSANSDEIDSIFHLPLDFLLEDKRLRTDVFETQNQYFWAPAYLYEGFEVWGFTARVLKTFLNKVLQRNIVMHNAAPVRRMAGPAPANPED